MTSCDGDRFSVYLVFAEPDGTLIQAASSLAGAGAALIAYAAQMFQTTDLLMSDGSPFELNTIAAMLPMDGCVWILSASSDEPIASIERRFFAP